MNAKPPNLVRNRTLATAISADDYARFEAVAKSHGVTVSTYLRAIVVDVLAEEGSKPCVGEREHVAA